LIPLFTGLMVILSVLIQSTILNRLAFFGARPDLVLIVVIMTGLLRGHQIGAGVGLGAGLLQDVLTGQFVGANALTKMCTGHIIGLTEGKFFKENLFIPMIMMAVGTIGNELLFWLVLYLFGRPLPFWLTSMQLILPTAILNSLLAPFVFSLMKRLNDFFYMLSR
jgi:rod shape-determining protein MreD